MKAQGIVKSKFDKKRGLNYGDIIELEPKAKCIAAVKDAVAASSEKGETVCYAEDVTIDDKDLRFAPQGDQFFGKYNNNSYNVKGTVVIRTLDAKRDVLKTKKEHKFELVFCDCLDEINQPDLKVSTFKLL